MSLNQVSKEKDIQFVRKAFRHHVGESSRDGVVKTKDDLRALSAKLIAEISENMPILIPASISAYLLIQSQFKEALRRIQTIVFQLTLRQRQDF